MLRGIRILRRPVEIQRAQRLLYDVYIKELNWIPSPDNPSELRVSHDQKIVCDKFDQEAVWFGWFRNNDLAATWRAIKPDNKFGSIDMQLYLSTEKHDEVLRILDENQYVQFKGLALERKYRGIVGFMESAMLASFHYAKNKKYGIITATPLAHLIGKYAKCGFKCLESNFRYEPDMPTSLMVLPPDKVKQAMDICRRVLLDPHTSAGGGR